MKKAEHRSRETKRVEEQTLTEKRMIKCSLKQANTLTAGWRDRQSHICTRSVKWTEDERIKGRHRAGATTKLTETHVFSPLYDCMITAWTNKLGDEHIMRLFFLILYSRLGISFILISEISADSLNLTFPPSSLLLHK